MAVVVAVVVVVVAVVVDSACYHSFYDACNSTSLTLNNVHCLKTSSGSGWSGFVDICLCVFFFLVTLCVAVLLFV